MKKIATVSILAAVLSTGLAGCIVAPVAPRVPVVYVGPSYPMPAPGYVWLRHPGYGHGWHHRSHGWHRGWR